MVAKVFLSQTIFYFLIQAAPYPSCNAPWAQPQCRRLALRNFDKRADIGIRKICRIYED